MYFISLCADDGIAIRRVLNDLPDTDTCYAPATPPGVTTSKVCQRTPPLPPPSQLIAGPRFDDSPAVAAGCTGGGPGQWLPSPPPHEGSAQGCTPIMTPSSTNTSYRKILSHSSFIARQLVCYFPYYISKSAPLPYRAPIWKCDLFCPYSRCKFMLQT